MKNLPPLGSILEQTEQSEFAATYTLHSGGMPTLKSTHTPMPTVPDNVVFGDTLNQSMNSDIERSGTFRDYRRTTLPK